MADPRIQPATTDEAAAIAAIYAHHVAHGTASYDIEPRSVVATEALIADHRAKGWPFLAARDGDGTLLGYAYASQFRPRAAYAWACEDSIYVAPAAQGRRVGRALLASAATSSAASKARPTLRPCAAGAT